MRTDGWRGRQGLVFAAALALALAGCGPRATRPRARGQVVKVAATPHALALLPLYVAAARVRDPNLTLEWVRRAPIIVAIQPLPPVAAFLLVRPDLVLVSPLADPNFRWRDLGRVPLTAADAAPSDLKLAAVVLKEHGVRSAITPLPLSEAQRWFREGKLPYLLAPLLPALTLTAGGRGAVLAYVGAATGPLPQAMLSGQSPELPRLLPALNAALAYIVSHSPAAVAHLVRQDYPGVPPHALAAAIAAMDGLGAWPSTSYPARAIYEHAAALMGPAAWPPYSSTVDPRPAADALGLPAAPP